MSETQHYYDIWHIAKGLKKKLRILASHEDCEIVGEWIPAITRHLYWCAISSQDSNNYPDEVEAKWKLAHITHHKPTTVDFKINCIQSANTQS